MKTKKQIDMKKIIKETKWFNKESMSYMSGYSKWYIYSRMPRAYVKFMILTFKNKQIWMYIQRYGFGLTQLFTYG